MRWVVRWLQSELLEFESIALFLCERRAVARTDRPIVFMGIFHVAGCRHSSVFVSAVLFGEQLIDIGTIVHHRRRHSSAGSARHNDRFHSTLANQSRYSPGWRRDLRLRLRLSGRRQLTATVVR
jgi:hypothetical protein